MEEVLYLNKLSKSFGQIKAVSGLTLGIPKASVYGILGPNGSGKTTTLAMVLGVIAPDAGDFLWFGKRWQANFNLKVGALLETPNFYPYLSPYNNLKIVAATKGIADPENEIRRVLQKVGLEKRQNTRFIALSLGMKQRLALASVLMGDPDVLVLDEPANGLDPQGIADVRQIILNERDKGKTIILASHILDEVEKVCSHVGILQNGSLIESGKVSELLKIQQEVIVTTDKNEEFAQILENSGLINSISIENGQLHLILPEGTDPKNINEFAFKQGFVLSSFQVKKKSLETEFLELTKKQN